MANINSVIGGHPTFTVTSSANEGREFALGDTAMGDDGSCWVYVEADEAIVQYDVVLIAEDFGVSAVDTTGSANAFGQSCGVAPVAFASGDYGWVQVAGKATANVLINASATSQLNSTGTDGFLDDDQTTGAENIDGIVLFSTATAAGGYSVNLRFPVVGATLT